LAFLSGFRVIYYILYTHVLLHGSPRTLSCTRRMRETEYTRADPARCGQAWYQLPHPGRTRSRTHSARGAHETQAHKRARAGLAHGRIRRAHAPPRAASPCERAMPPCQSRRAPSTRAVLGTANSIAYAAPAAKPPASALPPARSRTAVPLNLHQEPPPPPSAVFR
jgi:hypothetical protein